MSQWEAKDEIFETDVLVIGGGMGGILAAIKAKEAGAKNVLMVDKAKAGKSGCSAFAAGIIPCSIPEEDDQNAWFTEIVERGNYLNDQPWVQIIISELYGLVKEMDAWGVRFEKTPDGKFERKYMRGGVPGRPIKGVMFHGPQLNERIAEKAAEVGVKLLDRVMIVDLLTAGNRAVGAVGFDTRTGGFKVFKAKATVVAPGGTCYKSLFAHHKMESGDGAAMMFRAGVVLSGLDYLRHHASAAPFDTLGMNMYVALGGRFVNAQGEAFLAHYDPILQDHTLQGIYSQAMALEVRGGRGPIYMDMTHFTPADVAKMRTVLPLITKNLEAMGIVVGDKIVKKVEWVATNHGTVGAGGGARVNTKCETNIPGLYAVGDAAERRAAGSGATGVTGLAFTAPSGARAGRYAAEYAKGAPEPKVDKEQLAELKELALAPLKRKEGVDPDQVVLAMQEAIASGDVFVILHGDRLKKALEEVNDIEQNEVPMLCALDPHYLRTAHEAANMVLGARLWLTSVLERKESRGGILREDYPNTDNVNWLKWILAKKEGDAIKIETEEVPLEQYKLKPKREVFLAPMWQTATERGVKWG